MTADVRLHDQVDVSVIIPTYNRGAFIVEAIESVLAQTYPSVEIVVVDDGSTDDTLDRLAPYQSRLTLVNTNHGGAPHARNAGMLVAKGKYVAFLDSDDRYLAHKLAVQVQVLERFPDVGMVYSEFSGFGDGVTEEWHLKSYHEAAFRNGETYDHYFEQSAVLSDVGIECPPWSERKVYIGNIFDQYLRVLFVFVNSLMVRREVLQAVGSHDETLSLFDGYDLVLRLARKSRIAFVDLPTYELRYHDGQISTTKRHDGPAVFVAKQRQLLTIVERHGVRDEIYYRANKAAVDGVMARLYRALGIALMCHPGHEAEARSVLSHGKRYGLWALGLQFLTYMPGLVRRIAMKVGRGISQIRKKA
jgi:GT2 family glycosyltransferase